MSFFKIKVGIFAFYLKMARWIGAKFFFRIYEKTLIHYCTTCIEKPRTWPLFHANYDLMLSEIQLTTCIEKPRTQPLFHANYDRILSEIQLKIFIFKTE